MRLYMKPEAGLLRVLQRRMLPRGDAREMLELVLVMLREGRPEKATESLGWTMSLYAMLEEFCRLCYAEGHDVEREKKAITEYMKRRAEENEV